MTIYDRKPQYNSYRNSNGLLSIQEIKYKERIRQQTIKLIHIDEKSTCALCGIKNVKITRTIKITRHCDKKRKHLEKKPLQLHNLLQRHHQSYCNCVNSVYLLCPKCHGFVGIIENIIEAYNNEYIINGNNAYNILGYFDKFVPTAIPLFSKEWR
jgi:hypothetical protein